MKQEHLLPHHVEHLLSEGFTSEQIQLSIEMGVQSLSEKEALSMGFKVWDGKEWKSGAGIYFPFTDDFGQLRLDQPIVRKNGSVAKYLTPCKKKTQAYVPDACRAITEGIKDALAACWYGGIPTGAIAGVTHYRKALEKGSGVTSLYDHDALHNPKVFLNLINTGLWTNGKVQIIPKIPGHDKAGLCEYFKAGHTAEDYKKLLDSAYTPKELLMEWPKHWHEMPDKRISEAIKVALNLAAKLLDVLEQETLLYRIKTATKVSIKSLKAILQAARIKHDQKIAAEKGNEPGSKKHREWRYQPVAKILELDFNHCVTSQTFDGWIYRRLFESGKGQWMSKDSAFYRYGGNGSWSHVKDPIVNKLITDASTDAYKLQSSKDTGWYESYPYENNTSTSNAFKFCRKHLILPEGWPANDHLVAFKNVTVDMRTGETRPHDPEHRITRYIPYDYVSNRQCPEAFYQFIESSYGLDLLPVIRAFTSMFLDPTAPYGKFPHLIGASGSGKGVLGRLWNQMFGEKRSASLSGFKEINTPEGRYQYLTGKSICGFPDVGGYQQGLRAFYELVDNGQLSGRALYSATGHEIQWNCRFWTASVDYLQVENASDGWKRRAVPIPTLGAPKVVDPSLHLKLSECMADLIYWALAMPRVERDAILLGEPTIERISEAVRDAELHGDSAKVFVDMCLRPTAQPGAAISKQDLHSRYTSFCKAFGYIPASFTKFNNHVKTFLGQNQITRG